VACPSGRHAVAVLALSAIAVAACGARAPGSEARARGVPIPACTVPGRDADEDGLADPCELELARAFAPELIAQPGGCDWAPDERPPRLGGGYYFATAPARMPGHVRVAYLPAYYRDCGWSGPQCRLPFVDCSPHAGDSEFLVVEVEHSASEWTVRGIFLSAHCFDGAAPGCRWYRDGALAAFGWRGPPRASGPVVWVAAGRHANYPTREACERGHRWVDTCAGGTRRFAFPIASERQNIGSRLAPAGRDDGCVTAAHAGWNAVSTDADAVECLWSETRPFRGWQNEGAGATPYGRYLREVAEL
jgi:hypothetical protein